MQKGKVRKCKNCKTEIYTYNTTQNLCDHCKLEYIAKKREELRKRLIAKRAEQRRYHPPVRPLAKPIAPRKPIKKQGKESAAWSRYKATWKKAHPESYFECYYCDKVISREELTLDHKIPRSRRADLRYNDDNIVPCCWECNNEKGSMDAEAYIKYRKVRYGNAT